MPMINDCHSWKYSIGPFYINVLVWSGNIGPWDVDFSGICNAINKSMKWVSDLIDSIMKIIDKIRAFFGRPSVNYYVTWDWFESIVVTSGLSVTGENYSDTSRGSLGVQKDSFFDKMLWRLDSSDTVLPFPKDSGKIWCSTNPWICVFPGYLHWGSGKNRGAGLDWTAADYGIEEASGIEGFSAWDGSIGGVLLNTDFIWSCYQDSDTINEFVLKVAEGVNECAGDKWNLKLVEHPEDCSRLMVVDLDTTKMSTSVPKLDVGSVNSIAREWGMSTDIDDDTKYSIMMGCHSDPDGMQSTSKAQKVWRIYNKTITDKVIKKLKMPEVCPPTAKKPTGAGCVEQTTEGTDEATTKRELKNALIALSQDVTEETVDAATTIHKSYWASQADDMEDAYKDKQVTIPISFDMTIDGMGGLIWGHQFAVDQIIDAKVLPKGHMWMIQDISHTVDQKDWTTKVKTRLLLPKDNQTVTYSSEAMGVASNYEKAIKPPPPENTDDFEKVEDEETEEEVKDCLEKAFENRGYDWHPAFNLIGIRRLSDKGASTNKFTDIILLWYQPMESGEPKGEPVIGGPWDATTVPGHPSMEDGAAAKDTDGYGVGMLMAGQYKHSWAPRAHGENFSSPYDGKNKPWNLGARQAYGKNNRRGLPAIRNKDGDTVWDMNGKSAKLGGGYNIHRGSRGKNILVNYQNIAAKSTFEYNDNASKTGGDKGGLVEGWSTGCQVIGNQQDLHEMNNLLRPLLEAASGLDRDYITYTLLTEEDVIDCPEYQDGKDNFMGEQ